MTEIGTYCVCHRCRKTPILIYHPAFPFPKPRASLPPFLLPNSRQIRRMLAAKTELFPPLLIRLLFGRIDR